MQSKRPASSPPPPAKRLAPTPSDVNIERPSSLEVGSQVEALDVQELWFPARVVTVRSREVLVSFDGWDRMWDEWMPRNSPRLRRFRGWGTDARPEDYQIDTIIEALDMEGKWYSSRVLHVSENAVMVHFLRWSSKWDEWIDKDSGRLRPLGKEGAKLDGDRGETHEDLCATCEDAGELICCSGRCKRVFHYACVPAHNAPPAADALETSRWSCSDCKSKRFRCFICKRWGAERIDVHRCGKKNCGKMYHPECLVAVLNQFGAAAAPPRMPLTAVDAADASAASGAGLDGDDDREGAAGATELCIDEGGSEIGDEAAETTEAQGARRAEGAAPEAADGEWRSTGHRWLGRRVRRFFDDGPTEGTIRSWVSATVADAALWHMEHDDGDAEDLEAAEVCAALRAYSEQWTAPKRGLFAEPEDAREGVRDGAGDAGDAGGAAAGAGEAAVPATPTKAKQGGGAAVAGSPGGASTSSVLTSGGRGPRSCAAACAAACRSPTAAAADPPTPTKVGRGRPAAVTWAGLTCARHWCEVCKGPESSGYGQAMMSCVRCPASVHRTCAAQHAHVQLTSRTFLCDKCSNAMPRGLNAPDPVMSKALMTQVRAGVLPLPPADDLAIDAGTSLASFGNTLHLPKLQLKGAKEDFSPPEDVLESLRAREVVPTADFAPPPFAALRRSVYLHDQPREKMHEDDVTVCSCTLSGGGCDERCANRAMQAECTASTCKCGPACGNRPFANLGAPSQRPVQLFKTVGKGWGVMSTRVIEEGELVIEYVGEVIDRETWEARKERLWRFDHMYFMTLNSREIVDATERGNLARFLNHSCDPNMQVEKWYVNRVPRLGMWAKRQIMPGEELSYNYSVKWNGDPDVAQRCYCGAHNCTGYLGLPPKR